MITPIIYPSALDYWRNSWSYREDSVSVEWKDGQGFDAQSIFSTARRYDIRTPIHVMVPEASKRSQGEDFLCHVRPKNLPENSFVQLSKKVYISSPELCFLQAAQTLPLAELVVLANDLCAIYVKDEDYEYEQTRRTPVTDVKTITRFLNSAEGMKHIKKARRAIRYAVDRSNSPMESKLAAEFYMPISLGGMALLKGKSNLDINLSAKAARFYGKETCCVDFGWPDQKVVCEYDSNLTHLKPGQHAKDKKRATALSMSGYTVITITAEDLKTVAKAENVLFQLRKALHMPARPAQFRKYEEIRWENIRWLFIDSKFDFNQE